MSDWIDWHGGEQPVEDDVMVEVECRLGSKAKVFRAGSIRWCHRGYSVDIIRYRILDAEPQGAEDSPRHARRSHAKRERAMKGIVTFVLLVALGWEIGTGIGNIILLTAHIAAHEASQQCGWGKR